MIIGSTLRALWILAALTIGMAPASAQVSPIPQPPPNPNAPLPLPLSANPVPEPTTLGTYVKDKAAAIRLGKALFWDMQAGSDGVQACASCHFHAGADNRMKNQLNPGILHGASAFEAGGPNSTLGPGSFPFHRFQDPADRGSAILFDTDDVTSSQGVFKTTFVDIVPGSAVDNCIQDADPIWRVGGTKVRRVEPRNTPTAINAIFNFRNFWDGRAAFLFNGVNPVGPRDPNARVFEVQAGGAVLPVSVLIDNASLASQAVGPPGSPFEMSCDGRTFPKIGKKMLSLQPLAQQAVDATDSVLGALRHASGKGLSQTYSQMIQAAFHDKWWNANKVITFPGGVPAVADPSGSPLTTDQYTVMEANFSLFWGLAIQLYEATLVSGQTPFDRFAAGDGSALTPQQQTGLDVFLGQGSCDICHSGSLFSNATVPQIGLVGLEFEGLIENMHMALGLELSAINFVRGAVGAPPVQPLTFDPRGTAITLVPPGGMCGDPAAFAGMVPGIAGDCTPAAPAPVLLPATGDVPLNPAAVAVAQFSVGAACLQTFVVELASVAPGDWVLCVGGVERGLIPVVSVGGASEGGIDFESPPPAPLPADQPLAFDPRGAQLRIVAGATCGAPVAFETIFPGSPAPPCNPLVPVDASRIFSATVDVPPTGNVALGPFPLATAAFTVADDCSATFNVQLLGVPAGTYGVCVNGQLQGSLMVIAEAFYDSGFYNIGVRPTMEDLGIGGEAGGPIAFTRRLQLGLPVPELTGIQVPPPITPLSRIAVDGAFKVPALRNISLTAPYMHNGGMLTLAQVVEFYTRGADFFENNINDLDPEVGGIGALRGDPGRRAALVAFLESLTDDRVRFKKAPFDHPQLLVPNGHPGTSSLVVDDGSGKARDVLMELPAVGAMGSCIGLDGTRDTTPRPCPTPTATVEADVTVQQSAATTKFGTSTQLLADADTLKRTFFRVRLDGIGGRTVTSALLRLQVANTSTAPSNSGGRIQVIPNCNWSETTMTWNTQPSLTGGSLLDAEGPVAVNQIVDFDVTAAMLHDGVVCFVIDSLSSDAVTYNSREAASGKPQVLLSLAGNCDCSSAPAPTCGDGRVNTLAEECDGTSDGACPGRCQPNCLCQPPVCGDGAINRAGEVCDGAATGACSFGCTASCTCAAAPVLPPAAAILADVTVSSDTPGTNLGTKTQISADAGPTIKRTFVRVQVSNVGGRTVTQALLNLKVAGTTNAQSNTGGRIQRISNCVWGETTTTYNNQPALDGTVLQTLGAVAMNQTVTFNVTTAIPGDGLYCFAIDSASTDGVDYNSREASNGKPTLSISVAP